ncbi:OLC1v1032163C1 [Oldenlandia corymbosa var. corymbosa]|uniref:OLC1v1032163C1 n=1 Tax=Oldenlandia corymbosa var. corymbosa TaxID=529605 RepID=A0AAV1CL40_OLDCO|nr:OLC1v1032163C1 [Oldenlandia corymbosa var. corymbosa]
MTSTLQDSEISPEFHQETNIPNLDSAAALQLMAALQLNPGYSSINYGNHQAPATPQCTNCAFNKRQSPCDFSPEQPSSKRAAIQQQPSSSAGSSGDQLLQNGFTKIPLPSTVLSQTLSAPIPTKNLDDQISDGALAVSLIRNPLPEEISGFNSTPVPTQPYQQTIYRTYSEPIPEDYQAVATSATRRPPAAGKVTRRPGFSLKTKSPDTKRFRRMKERLREMKKWWDEVIKEGEEEEDADSGNNDHCPPKDDTEASQGCEAEEASHDQEAVWVERKGEVLILHFKCPCSKGYQILLSGDNCYYKLSTF